MSAEEGKLIETATRLLFRAKHTDWQRRKTGGYSRFFKFDEPLTKDLRGVIVLAVCLFDGPNGKSVLPGTYKDEVSDDGLYLRIRVARRTPAPVTTPAKSAAFSPSSLFGSHASALQA